MKAQVSGAGGKVYAAAAQENGSAPSAPAESNYATTKTSGVLASTSQGAECNFYAYAKADEGYAFAGWSTSNGGSIASTDNPYKVVVECNSSSSSSPTTKTRYAIFKAKVNSTLTFKTPTNGTFTVNGQTVSSSDYVLTTQDEVKLVATPASGYKVYRWKAVSGSSTTYFSYNTSVNKTFFANTTISVEFIEASTPIFAVGATQYTDINAAISKASADGATNTTIVLVGDGTLPAGSYTIPSGVTFLIPYSSQHTVSENVPDLLSAWKTPTVYRKLTLASGCNLTISGKLCVNAQQKPAAGGDLLGGVPTGPYGYLYLNEGSTLTLRGGARLYAWGYVAGEGQVNVLKNAYVYENFQITDFRGGTATSGLLDNSHRCFLFNQYYVQNIEAPIRFAYGSREYVYSSFNVAGSTYKTGSVFFIGQYTASDGTVTKGLFSVSEGGAIRRWYDKTTDRIHYEVNGDAAINSMKISIAGETVNTTSYTLPLTCNMSIALNEGASFAMANEMAALGGFEMQVKEGATFNIKSGGKLYVYDQAQWLSNKHCFDSKYTPTPYSPTRTHTRVDADFAGTAKIQVDGLLTVSGALYTSSTGANICSSGTGVVNLAQAAPANTTGYLVGYENGGNSYHSYTLTSAKLKNGSGSYTATAGAAAGSIFTYKDGVWKTTSPYICYNLNYAGADNTNLFHWGATSTTVEKNGVTCKYDRATGYITLNGTMTASASLFVAEMPGLKEGDKVTIGIEGEQNRVNMEGTRNRCLALDITNSAGSYSTRQNLDISYVNTPSVTEKTFTIADNEHTSLRLYLYRDPSEDKTGDMTFSDYKFKIRVEKGETWQTTSAPSGNAMTVNKAINTMPTVGRCGYMFDGWYTDPSAGQLCTNATLYDGSTNVLYAHWSEPNVVLFDANHGDGTSAPNYFYWGDELSGEANGSTYTYDPATAILTLNGGPCTATSVLTSINLANVAQGDALQLQVQRVSQKGYSDADRSYYVELGQWKGSSVKDGRLYHSVKSAKTDKLNSWTADGNYPDVRVRIYRAGTGTQDVTFDNYQAKIRIEKGAALAAHGSPSGKTAVPGQAIGALPVPAAEKAGYEFMGWYTAADGGTLVTSSTVYDRAQHSMLYAHWGVAKARVTADGFSQGFSTFDEAFNAIKNGSYTNAKLTMLDNSSLTGVHTFTKSMTLDLNGYTLTSDTVLYVNASGITLDIVDNSVEGTGVISVSTDKTRVKDDGTSIGCTSYALRIYNGTVNLHSGTIRAGNTVRKSSANAIAVYISSANGSFCLRGGKLLAETYNTPYGVYMEKAGSFTMTGGQLECHAEGWNSYGVYATAGTVNITGGTIYAGTRSASSYGVYATTGNVTLDGDVTITAERTVSSSKEYYAYPLFLKSDATGSLTVYGGKYKGLAVDSKTAAINSTAPAGKVSIYGGYYNINTGLETKLAANSEVRTLTEDEPEYAEGYRYTVKLNHEAEVVTSAGVRTLYASFEEALTAANAATDATLRLLNDATVEASQSITAPMTLDLNGKTLSGSIPYILMVNLTDATKSITILDSSSSQDGQIKGLDTSSTNARCLQVNKGMCVLESGSLVTEATSKPSLTIHVQGSGKMTIYGGAVIATASSEATAINTYKDITINGGTISATSTGGNATGIMASNGTTTVHHASILVTAKKTATGLLANATSYTNSSSVTTYYVGNIVVDDANVEVQSTTPASYVTYAMRSVLLDETHIGSLTIQGGKYKLTSTSNNQVINVGEKAGTATITGGYFSHNENLAARLEGTLYEVVPVTDEALLADGYNHTIKEFFEAEVNGTPYHTFEEALAATTTDCTLRLLRNTTVETKQTINKSLVFDLNGYTLSGAVNQMVTISGTDIEVTVRDTRSGGEIHMEGAIGNVNAVAVYVYKGTLTLESGTIYGKNTTLRTSTETEVRSYAVWVAKNQAFEMTGGRVRAESPSEYAFAVLTYGTTNITGGELYAVASKKYAAGVYLADASATLETSNTTIIAETQPATTADADAWGVYAKANGSVVTIGEQTTIRGLVTTADGSSATGNAAYGIRLLKGTTLTINNAPNILIEANASGNQAYGVSCLGTATISGGSISAISQVRAYGVHAKVEISSSTGAITEGEVTIEGGATISAWVKGAPTYATNGALGIYVEATSTTISGKTGDKAVYNGDYAAAATATINGGVIEAKSQAQYAYAVYVCATQTANAVSASPVCSITGGKFKATSLTGETNYICETNSPTLPAGNYTISGGYFNLNKNMPKFLAEYKQVRTLADSEPEYAEGYRYQVEDVVVASVTTAGGETSFYPTFPLALAAANSESGCTLRLEDDIEGVAATQTISNSMTLDLNGHTLSGSASPLVSVYPGKEVTLTDAIGGGRIYNRKDELKSIIALSLSGTLNLTSGTIECVNEEPNTSNSATKRTIALSMGTSATLNMSGGKLYAHSDEAGWAEGMSAQGTVNITGGEIHAKTATNWATAIYGWNSNAKITIENANIHAEAGTMQAYGILMQKNDNAYIPTITINGGTVIRTGAQSSNSQAVNCKRSDCVTINSGAALEAIGTSSCYAIIVNDDGTTETGTTVNGGKFKAQNACIANTSPWLIVNGGYYSNNTNLETIKSAGKIVRALAESEPEYTEGYRYQVTDAPVASVIDSEGHWTGYSTFPPALAAANAESGCTLRLEDDIEGVAATQTISESMTFDLNGHALSGSVNQLVKINAKDKEVTITDNSAEKGGRIVATPFLNNNASAVYISAGKLIVEGGTISCANQMAYDATDAKSVRTFTVFVTSTGELNVTGGTIQASGTGTRSAIYTKGTGTVVSGGYLESNQYGVYVSGEGSSVKVSDGYFKVTRAYVFSSDAVSSNSSITGGYYSTNSGLQAAEGYGIFASSEVGYPYMVQPLLGEKLDIVDWTASTLTLNMNGYSSPSARTGWTISANGQDYTTANRATDRTMVVNTGTLANGSSIAIEANGTDGVVESRQLYTKPYIYTANQTYATTTDGRDLWQKSGRLTISGNVKLGRVVICPGAELVITAGNTLTCSELVLRTEAFSAAAFTNNGTLACDHVYYTRIMADKTQTYQIAFPYDITVANVKLSNGKTAPFGQTWGLNYYDAANRAANGIAGQLNWKGCNPATFSTMQANTGYQIQSASAYYMEFYFPVAYTNKAAGQEIAVTAHTGAAAAANPIHGGWNYIVSPYTHKYAAKYTDPSEGIKICELYDDNRNFHQYVPTTIQPAAPFYYQASANGKLNFDDESFTFEAAVPASVAARTAVQPVQTQWLQLNYEDENGMADETHIYLSPTKFSMAYETGYDVVKMTTSGARPLIYSTLACGDLAFAALPDSAAEQGIPLMVNSPAAGEYTFSLTDNEWLDRLEAVYLLDQESGAVIDLLLSDYVVALPQGTAAGRFFLQTVFAQTPGVATEVQSAACKVQSETVEKFMWEEHIYIRRGEHVYDMNGREVVLK